MNGWRVSPRAELRRQRLMNNDGSIFILRRPANGTYALALILLTTIFWGAIVEVNHHHSGTTESRSLSAVAEESLPQNIKLFRQQTSSNKNSTTDECLICRLQQNLFATVLGHTLHETPATAQFLRPTAFEVFRESLFSTSKRGRAPPVIL